LEALQGGQLSDNIKVDIEERGNEGVDWIYLTQDSD
jgi:hypothetical protein